SAFPHRDVVRRIETCGRQVSERSYTLSLEGRSNGIAAVLNHPEIVFCCKRHDLVQRKRIPQRVRQNDRSGPRRKSRFELCRVDVVSRYLYINEDRNQPILNDWIDGSWKPGCDGDHLVAWTELPFSQRWRCQARERKKVRR